METPQTKREALIAQTLKRSTIEITTLTGAPLDVDVTELFRAFQSWLARDNQSETTKA